MNFNEQLKLQVDDAWLDALLHSAYHTDRENEAQRISGLVGSLDNIPLVEIADQPQDRDNASAPVIIAGLSQSKWRKSRSVRIAWLAASMIFVAMGWYAMTGRKSVAAVQQVLTQILDAPLQHRTYDLTLVNQLLNSEQRIIRGKLYLNDRDQFAVELPGWFDVGKFWIGGSPNERWVVPPVGPALVGVERIIGIWLNKQDVPSPYLHLNTIVVRMGQAYKVQQLPDDRSPSQLADSNRLCTHLVGTRRDANSTMPSSIELWAEASSGTLHQVILHWDRSSSEPSAEPSAEHGPLSWTIQLSAMDVLPSAIFRPDGHSRPNQVILNIQSEHQLSELDAIF